MMEYWLDTARLLIVAWNSFRRKMSRELFLTNSVFLLVAGGRTNVMREWRQVNLIAQFLTSPFHRMRQGAFFPTHSS
jgi:hypothetical protein